MSDESSDAGLIQISSGAVDYGGKKLAYYHCGPHPSSSNSNDDDKLTELVLLHGSAFTKEDWKTSGILDMFYKVNIEGGSPSDDSRIRQVTEFRHPLSITALDLPVSALGHDLSQAFDSLTSQQILSGRPVTFVSPSASGKTIVSLGEMATDPSSSNEEKNELKRMVKAWIPVASGSVLQASEEVLGIFMSSSIPVFSIHGDQDAMGKQTTERLKSMSNARGKELVGRHPVYLDSPNEFVAEVLRFLEETSF